MRDFVIGDIHGACRALRQVLQKAGFRYDEDHLICLGDVADGWPETKASIDELLRVKNLTYILGNHDWWTLEWMLTGHVEDVWYAQGGKATVDSYNDNVPADHLAFLSGALLHFELRNKLFVHAGIRPNIPLSQQDRNIFLWDRTLAALALESYPNTAAGKICAYDEVYIGHTPIPFSHPVHSRGVWLMDTGAGWSGVLSMMDIDTKEIFASQPVPSLYPGIDGRKRNG